MKKRMEPRMKKIRKVFPEVGAPRKRTMFPKKRDNMLVFIVFYSCVFVFIRG
jgi:hypothetical protein